MKKCIFIIAVLAFAFAAGCMDSSEGDFDFSEVTPSAPFNTHFYNPIKSDLNLGDPWVFKHGNLYYHCGGGINIFASPSITAILSYNRVAMDRKDIWFDIKPEHLVNVWAPELYFHKGLWYVFFTATHGVENSADLHLNRRMYTIRSLTDDPMGDWEFRGKLELPEDQWAIDGTFFEHNDRLFTIWSGWANYTEGIGTWRQRLYICELEPDDPTRVLEGTTRVEIANPTYAWEIIGNYHNEGAAVIKSPAGTVFCIYSGSYSGGNNYALGYLKLIGDDPMVAENWVKNPEALLLPSATDDVYSPGHCSITMSPDGTEYWVIYHAAKAQGAGWDRNARAQRLYWENDEPYMMNSAGVRQRPEPVSTLLPLPSGEIVDRTIYQAEDMILGGNARVVDKTEGGQAVRLVTGNYASVSLIAFVEQAGSYGVTVRHTNPSADAERFFRLYINDSHIWVRIHAGRSGQGFTQGANIAMLHRGLNKLTLMTEYNNLDVDCVILERLQVIDDLK